MSAGSNLLKCQIKSHLLPLKLPRKFLSCCRSWQHFVEQGYTSKEDNGIFHDHCKLIISHYQSLWPPISTPFGSTLLPYILAMSWWMVTIVLQSCNVRCGCKSISLPIWFNAMTHRCFNCIFGDHNGSLSCWAIRYDLLVFHLIWINDMVACIDSSSI